MIGGTTDAKMCASELARPTSPMTMADSGKTEDANEHTMMYQNRTGIGPMPAASGRFRTRSGTLWHTSDEDTVHVAPITDHVFQCPLCDLTCNSAHVLDGHLRTRAFGDDTFHCEICGLEFIGVQNLMVHTDTHQHAHIVVCGECGCQFKDQEHFRIHKKSHDVLKPSKPLQCSECCRSFNHPASLNKHFRLKHKADFPCKICGQVMRYTLRYTYYSKHGKECDILPIVQACTNPICRGMEHIFTKDFLCAVCGKSFKFNNQLEEHSRIHTNERPYNCRYCSKSFTHSVGLRQHIRIHTGEKRHQCPECDKCFTEKSKLTKHMRVHSGERPYSCSVCNKGFATSSNLHTHMVVHTGERPFQCEKCQQAFTLKGNLTKHMDTVHAKDGNTEGILCEEGSSTVD